MLKQQLQRYCRGNSSKRRSINFYFPTTHRRSHQRSKSPQTKSSEKAFYNYRLFAFRVRKVEAGAHTKQPKLNAEAFTLKPERFSAQHKKPFSKSFIRYFQSRFRVFPCVNFRKKHKAQNVENFTSFCLTLAALSQSSSSPASALKLVQSFINYVSEKICLCTLSSCFSFFPRED